MMLLVDNVFAGYGAAPVLQGVSFSLQEGEVMGVVGHNGMGKTTLLRTLMGIVACMKGRVALDGHAIEGQPTHRRSQLGLGYVPQGDPGFPALSVRESLDLAGLGGGATPAMGLEEILGAFPRLERLLGRRSGALSGGERQLLALARAVARRPRVLLLDEMTEGVQPSVVEEIADALRSIHAQGSIAILVVDQDLAFVGSLAQRCLVMKKGRVVGEVEAADLPRLDLIEGAVV